MNDTIRLRSPYLTEEVAEAIERQMVRLERVNLATGEVHYALTRNTLPGSYSDKVSVQIERSELRADTHVVAELLRQRELSSRRRPLPVRVPTPPYIVMEGSVHKAMAGHNVYGGPCAFGPSCRWFVGDVARRLGVDLPPAGAWEVQRTDWAEVYDLGSFEAVQEFIAGLNSASYPRREAGRYAEHSLHVPGYTTTVKFYHKGVEFAGNDANKLRGYMSPERLEELQGLANRLLRVEVAVKLRKLRADFQRDKVRVDDVTAEYLESVHDLETRRLLKEGQSEMETVRRLRDVDARLRAVYGNDLGSGLFSTWTRFATLGEQEARKNMPRRTYYRHKKQLTEAGCSWHVSDVVLIRASSAVPAGFSPVRSDPRRMTVEAPEVITALRMAA